MKERCSVERKQLRRLGRAKEAAEHESGNCQGERTLLTWEVEAMISEKR